MIDRVRPQLVLDLPIQCMAPLCDARATVRIELGDFSGNYCAKDRPSRATVSHLEALYALAVKVTEL